MITSNSTSLDQCQICTLAGFPNLKLYYWSSYLCLRRRPRFGPALHLWIRGVCTGKGRCLQLGGFSRGSRRPPCAGCPGRKGKSLEKIQNIMWEIMIILPNFFKKLRWFVLCPSIAGTVLDSPAGPLYPKLLILNLFLGVTMPFFSLATHHDAHNCRLPWCKNIEISIT